MLTAKYLYSDGATNWTTHIYTSNSLCKVLKRLDRCDYILT